MNTGEKLYAIVMVELLAAAAEVIVASPQRGFARDRSLVDSVVGLDVAMTEFSVLDPARPAAVLLHFSNACPSLSHGWIHWVLEGAGAPESLWRVVKAMYSDPSRLSSTSMAVVSRRSAFSAASGKDAPCHARSSRSSSAPSSGGTSLGLSPSAPGCPPTRTTSPSSSARLPRSCAHSSRR